MFSAKRLLILLALLWSVVAFVIFWQYDLVQRKLDADASFMLYAGQQILRGYAPYVGVGIVKLPVSPLVAAGGIGAGRLFGVDDILAGRFAFALCAATTVGAVFLLGARVTQVLTPEPPNALALLAGSFAAASLSSFQALGVQVAEGPEAKLPMICAGMVCAVLLAYRRFFWAGLAAALSFMAWQPGLIFVVAAFLCALVAQPRARSLMRALAGAAIPPVLIGVYLALNGAFASMLRQAFGANANYLGEKKVAAGILGVVAGNVTKVWDISMSCSATETPLVALGFLGMIGGGAFLLWRMWKRRDAELLLSAGPLLLSGAALFGFSLLDLQACSDVVPLLPFLALGSAFVLTPVTFFAARLIARASSPLRSGEQTTSAKRHSKVRQTIIVGVPLLVFLLAYGASDAFRAPRQNRLDQQRELAQTLEQQLGPGDRVQQFGDTVFLVMTRRENATRFVHLGEKQGLGILTAEGISIADLVQQLDQANPRLITLSRAKTKKWAAPLYHWIETEYTLQASYTALEGGTQAETDVWVRR